MPLKVAFHLGLHCLLKKSSETEMRCVLVAPKSTKRLFEPVHEISNNVVCTTGKASYQPAHTRSLIRVFASHLSIFFDC